MSQNGYFSNSQTIQSTYSNFTTGSVVFQGTSGFLTQDNVNLFWNDASNYFGIGTNSPAFTLQVMGTAAVTSLYGNETTFAANDSLTLGPGTSTNFFLDRPSGGNQLIIGYNTPKSAAGPANTLQVYNNATDQTSLLICTSRGTTSGTNMVSVVNLTDLGVPSSAAGAPLTVTSGQVVTYGLTNTEVNSSSAINLNTTAAVLGGATVTPAAGTYLVIASVNVTASSASGGVVSIDLYVGGTPQIDTLRACQPYGGAVAASFQNMSLATNKIVTVNGSQAIALYGKTSAGTGTITGLNFDVVRIA